MVVKVLCGNVFDITWTIFGRRIFHLCGLIPFTVQCPAYFIISGRFTLEMFSAYLGLFLDVASPKFDLCVTVYCPAYIRIRARFTFRMNQTLL